MSPAVEVAVRAHAALGEGPTWDPATGEPAPGASGTSQNFTVSGLTPTARSALSTCRSLRS